MRTRTAVLAVACATAIEASTVVAQEGDATTQRHGPQFKLGAEVKLDLRHSSFQEFRLAFPAPPSFFAPGDDALYMRTPAAGNSLKDCRSPSILYNPGEWLKQLFLSPIG